MWLSVQSALLQKDVTKKGEMMAETFGVMWVRFHDGVPEERVQELMANFYADNNKEVSGMSVAIYRDEAGWREACENSGFLEETKARKEQHFREGGKHEI